MKSRSLRTRLLIAAAGAIFVAVAAAWLVMIVIFERHIERRVAAELTRHAVELVAALRLDASGVPSIDAEPSDPRFEAPAGGLYWQLTTSSGSLRSRSLWDQELPAVPTALGSANWSLRNVDGPFEQHLMLVERRVRPDRDGPAVEVQVGFDRRALRTASAEFGGEIAVFLALLWLILCAAAAVQVHVGLRPLGAVRQRVDALRHDAGARVSAADVIEIAPLVDAINSLAGEREKDLVVARRRAADLAHGLKTPLAALAAQSRLARAAGAVAAADGLDRAIAAATAAVENELRRTRVAVIRRRPHAASCDPRAVIERIVGVVERTDFGTSVVFDVVIPEGLRAPLAAEDLTELAGALVENAARFARRHVRIDAFANGRFELRIEDDGPGLGETRAQIAALQGAARLDELGPGHGLGLPIAREIAEATGATIELEQSTLGGLAVVVRWPIGLQS